MAQAAGKASFALQGGKEPLALEPMDSRVPLGNPGAKTQADKLDEVGVQAVAADTLDARKVEASACEGLPAGAV